MKPEGGAWVDTTIELTDSEKAYLARTVRRKNLWLTFSLLSVAVAVSFLVYHVMIAKDLNGLRFVIILLLLLTGRSHLRQYRTAVIFSKLKCTGNQVIGK